MAKNDFKPFATAANANVVSQADWESLPALLSGFTAGKASSAQVNKAIRQAAFIAAALAQYTANKSGLDVLDDGDVAGFIAKMSSAFGKDYQPLDATLTAFAALPGVADSLAYFTGPDAVALTNLTQIGRNIISKTSAADVLNYLSGAPLNSPALTGIPTVPTAAPGTNTTQAASTAFMQAAITALSLGTASQRSVGTGTNQIPDMSKFNAGTLSAFKLPTGHIVQFDSGSTGSTGGFTKAFPIPFPNACLALLGVVYNTLGFRVSVTANTSSTTFANMNFVDQNGNGLAGIAVGYISIGY